MERINEQAKKKERKAGLYERLFSLGVLFIAGWALIQGFRPIHPSTIGLTVTELQSPITVPLKGSGSKSGEATAIIIMGLAANGDASIAAAARNGGITKIMTIDCKSDSLLGVFSRVTTKVTGE